MAVSSVPCSSIPHSCPWDAGAIQKRHFSKEEEGAAGHSGQAATRRGLQVSVGGHSMDQPLLMIN